MPERDWLRVEGPSLRFILQGDAAARAAAGRAFGVALPEEACRANSANGRAALWLGPDEQLLLGPAGEERAVSAALRTTLAGIAHSLVEVSDRQIALSVSTSRATSILNSGCPLDLDPSEFPVGACARTLLGKAEVVLWRRGAEEYHLEVARSFGGYVLAWLHEAAALEFGQESVRGD